ncbi:MAG TPA: hypothetical protein VF190_12855 [Rhodothermales bacterium]
MNHPHSNPSQDGRQTALVSTFALLSAAMAAVRVLRSVRERREGRDPSGQETPADATLALAASVEALQDLLLPVLITAAVSADDPEIDERARLIRRFDEMHRAAEATVLLHRIHQRLLSLYPAVPEQVVEEARILEGALSEVAAGDGPGNDSNMLVPFERAHAFCARLQPLLRANFSA